MKIFDRVRHGADEGGRNLGNMGKTVGGATLALLLASGVTACSGDKGDGSANPKKIAEEQGWEVSRVIDEYIQGSDAQLAIVGIGLKTEDGKDKSYPCAATARLDSRGVHIDLGEGEVFVSGPTAPNLAESDLYKYCFNSTTGEMTETPAPEKGQ